MKVILFTHIVAASGALLAQRLSWGGRRILNLSRSIGGNLGTRFTTTKSNRNSKDVARKAVSDDESFDTILEEDAQTSRVVEPGHVYYVATPLGNLKDITRRAIEVLSEVDLICAEDTRHTIKLLRHLGIPYKSLLSHHEHNWRESIPKILSSVQSGKSIAVVSDAGTPGISDPGAELAAALADNRVPMHPIPGPSAVVSALSVCGFPTSEFTFMGFLPVKGKERQQKIDTIFDIKHCVVIYEAPHRIKLTLEQLSSRGMGDRPCVCCREITKLHEEFRRGTVDQCLRWLNSFGSSSEGETVNDSSSSSSSSSSSNGEAPRIKGEFTVVLGPFVEPELSPEESETRIKDSLRKLQQEGSARSEAVKLTTKALGVSKSIVYKLALEMDW
jgi:16S rRNA (cytidine1402-2'-O)-methyltransferase